MVRVKLISVSNKKGTKFAEASTMVGLKPQIQLWLYSNIHQIFTDSHRQEETLERLEDFLGMPLARIIVRPDSVGRWKTADGNYNFDFLEESIEENQYHQDSV